MTIYGADTSHWKWTPGIDFKRMKASGRCDYLIAKATEGVGYADPSYAGWRAGSKGSGMLFGSFHFARPGDPVAQADYYLSVAKPVDGELVCLDLEDEAIPAAGSFGAEFCERVKSKTGTWPLLYTYPNYLQNNDLSAIGRLGVPLWFADYSDPLNSIKPWSSYVIRQFTSTGSLPGLPATNVDLNSSPLTLDGLRRFAIGAAPQPVSQPDLEDVDMKVFGTTDTKRGYILAGYDLWWEGNPETFAAAKKLCGGDGETVLQRDIDVVAARLAQRRASLAADVASLASPGSTADIEAALRKVLGSLDDAPAS